jgi:hypothetical protein
MWSSLRFFEGWLYGFWVAARVLLRADPQLLCLTEEAETDAEDPKRP